jgi:sterol desaturase/sphingolipid hydroxylase (fatty acid hydroxylase superfamily)
VWFSYGPLLSKLFISPAQHQIHHSSARKHWDKNFGFIFAFWDLFFRSLYVPKEREELTFGLGEGRQEDIQYRSVTALYLLPFKKAYRRIVGRR